MKFLCDNCKAKYQIGDDKVAGKTVRMKCRRCGHSITVSSKVTESSVSRQLPADPNQPTLSVPPEAAPESGRAPRPDAPEPRAPLRSDEDESTQIMQIPVAPSRPGAPPARPRPAAGAPPPRPSGVGVGPTALRAPPPPRPSGAVVARAPAPVRELRPSPVKAVPKPTPSPPQPAVDPGGVAAAFQRAVADPQATAASSRHPPHEDWYVGVNGQPLGPVRVDVIREKATLGQVDGDSLVWREGFDEWQPLKKFPELLEVVHGARMARLAPKPVDPAPAPFQQRNTGGIGAAAALAAPAGGVRHVPTAPAGGAFGTQAMPVAPEPAPAPVFAPIPAPVAVPAPAAVAAAPAPSPVKAVSVLSDPFALPAAPGPSKPAPEPPIALESAFNLLAPPPEKGVVAVPLAAELPAVPPPVSGAASADLASLIPRRTGIHPMAYAFIAMAAVFGGVAAYFLFFKPPVAPQIVYVEKQVPGTPGVATAAGAATGEPPASTEPSASPTAKVGAGAGGPRTKGPVVASGPTAAPASGGPAAPAIDTSGFNNGGVGGPSAGNSPSTAGGTGTLSQGEIQGVVNSNQARIRRQCWENALTARSPNAPSTARVNGQLTIGPSGNVENATASGADAYPGLASCIQGKMKSWKFPSSGGSQTVNVPFVFAAQ